MKFQSYPLPYFAYTAYDAYSTYFYPYLHFCAENVVLAGYKLSDDEDQDDQPGLSGPHQPPPGVVPPDVPTVLLPPASVPPPQVPAGLQFGFYVMKDWLPLG